MSLLEARELLNCLKQVVAELMIDFPDDDPKKIRYIQAIENATDLEE